MKEGTIDAIADWTIRTGLAGISETELLNEFCERCNRAGMSLSRVLALMDTLHPVYEGRAFRWRNDGVDEEALLEYRPTIKGDNEQAWLQSAFYHLMSTGNEEVRRRIGHGDPTDFLYLDKMKGEGYTDFVALAHRFSSAGVIGEMDCFYSHWATKGADGFSELDMSTLRRLAPALGLAIKCASLARIAGTLVEVYLGRDAGQRVLSGRISRGVADKIQAVLWYSDLRGYTSITDSAPPSEIIPLLNDYAELVIEAVHGAGGDVLKLIGDGVLAIFNTENPAEDCRNALHAEQTLRASLAALNARRATAGRPVTSVYLGLHIGEVFYGNIGSEERLDFTVVGPAVNEVSRIAAMCRSADRSVLLSREFVAATPERQRADLVSVGRYALRGVGRAQELFTVDPTAAAQ